MPDLLLDELEKSNQTAKNAIDAKKMKRLTVGATSPQVRLESGGIGGKPSISFAFIRVFRGLIAGFGMDGNSDNRRPAVATILGAFGAPGNRRRG
jgi:hypothetical protein